MKRGGQIRRTKAVNPANKKRKANLRESHFGPPGFVEFVHRHGCVVARDGASLSRCEGPVEAAHRKSRGAGGGWRHNVYGLCRKHHQEQHSKGLETFETAHHLDGDLWACAITGKFDDSTYNDMEI